MRVVALMLAVVAIGLLLSQVGGAWMLLGFFATSVIGAEIGIICAQGRGY